MGRLGQPAPETPPLAPETPRLAPIVQVGKIKSTPTRTAQGFRLRLTRTQFQHLFPGVERLPRGVWPRARCGLWGCAYPRGVPGSPHAGEIVKFTADDDEAVTASRLMRRPVPGVVPVFGVYKLKTKIQHCLRPVLPMRPSPEPCKVYAIRAARFGPPNKLTRAVTACGRRFAEYRVGRRRIDDFYWCLEQSMERAGIKDRDRVKDFVIKAFQAVRGLDELGVRWTDFHSGNVSQDEHGNPVIIDIGPWKIEEGPDEVAVLEGSRRRRR